VFTDSGHGNQGRDHKMKKTAIITDSNSGISQAEARDLGIFVVPMPFYIDEALYFEDITLTQPEFYQRLREGADIKTSQPAPESITALWNEALREYDDLVHIPMSSGLSGTCQTAVMLAQDYDGRVRVADNRRISVTLRQSVMEARSLAEKGFDAAQIAALLERDALEASVYIAVDTLKYLKKGGRITPAAAALGTLFDIKPVLQIQGGKLDAFAKVRGARHARQRMLEAVEADLNGRFRGCDVLIHGAYTCSDEEAATWKREIETRFPGQAVRLDRLSLSVACHIGEGATAVVCMKKMEEAL